MSYNPIQLLIPAVWLYFGLFTLKYVDQHVAEKRAWRPWLNLAALFLGPVVLALFPVGRAIAKSGFSFRKLFPARKPKRPAQGLELIGASGTPVLDPERPHDNPAAVVLLRALLTDAIRKQAGEINFEPRPNRTMTIRFRHGATSKPVREVDLELGEAMIDEIKTAADLNLAEKRAPQEGGFSANLPESMIRFRASTAGIFGGEKLTIRLLLPGTGTAGLDALNLGGGETAAIRNALKKPTGLILISGPPGSGRTTTMYTLMEEADTTLRIAFSVENRIGRAIPGVSQMEVGGGAADNQAALIGTALQQTPDMLFIDELTDPESMKMALRAARELLVIAVIPGGDLGRVLSRFPELGISPAALARVLLLLLSQRLVRKLCSCRQKGRLTPEIQDYFQQAHLSDANVCLPAGCRKCNGTGYDGALPVFDLVQVSDHLRDLLDADGVPISMVRQELEREHGSSMLVYRGFQLVSTGQTSEDEVRRAILTQE